MAWSHALIDRYDPEDVLPLAAMKAELDVTHDDDDELITSHRDAGISFVEEYTSRYLGPVTIAFATDQAPASGIRSEEHTSELQSLMRISYAVFCLKKKKKQMKLAKKQN